MKTNFFVGRRCCDSLMCMQMPMSAFSCPEKDNWLRRLLTV